MTPQQMDHIAAMIHHIQQKDQIVSARMSEFQPVDPEYKVMTLLVKERGWFLDQLSQLIKLENEK
jgi:hypothetical protein